MAPDLRELDHEVQHLLRNFKTFAMCGVSRNSCETRGRRRCATGVWKGETGESMADTSRRIYATKPNDVEAWTIIAIVRFTVHKYTESAVVKRKRDSCRRRGKVCSTASNFHKWRPSSFCWRSSLRSLRVPLLPAAP